MRNVPGQGLRRLLCLVPVPINLRKTQKQETDGLWCDRKSMKWCVMVPAHDALLASIGACVSGMARVIGVLVSVTSIPPETLDWPPVIF